MVAALLQTKRAAAIWLDKLDSDADLSLSFLWDTLTASCTTSANKDIYAHFGGMSNIEVTADHIETDPDSCIAYFALSGIQVRYVLEAASPFCNPSPVFPGQTDPGFAFLNSGVTTLDIGNGPADQGPSGNGPTAEEGIPVVAAVHVGGDNYLAFAAGTVAAATLANAIAACGTAGVNLCGAGVENVNLYISFQDP